MKKLSIAILAIVFLLSMGRNAELIEPPKNATETIQVYFLYGSKPSKKSKSEEAKWFGGKHGGHVGIGINKDEIVSFLPTSKVHIVYKKKKRKSRFVTTSEKGFWRILGGDGEAVKKMVIHIPVTIAQKEKIDSIHLAYIENTPYDYAFFGMRCAAATYEILSQAEIVKEYNNGRTWKKFFYPKKLRTNLLRKAQRNNWTIESDSGRASRKWENDKEKLEMIEE